MIIRKELQEDLLATTDERNGPFTLWATHGRQAPHYLSGQQLRAIQTGIQ